MHIHACMHACMLTYLHARTHAYMHVLACACMMHACACMHAGVERRVVGLCEEAATLNGRRGRVVWFDSALGRYIVRLEPVVKGASKAAKKSGESEGEGEGESEGEGEREGDQDGG